MQIPEDRVIKEFANLLVQQNIYNEGEADELLCALIVLRDYSAHIWNESFPEILSALRNNALSIEDKSVPIIDMQIYLREIYLQLNDLKWFGIEAT
jgi:hypothetical protein